MTELISCPFCGGDGAIGISKEDSTIFGCCWVCGSRGMAVAFNVSPGIEDIEKAVKAWNERIKS